MANLFQEQKRNERWLDDLLLYTTSAADMLSKYQFSQLSLHFYAFSIQKQLLLFLNDELFYEKRVDEDMKDLYVEITREFRKALIYLEIYEELKIKSTFRHIFTILLAEKIARLPLFNIPISEAGKLLEDYFQALVSQRVESELYKESISQYLTEISMTFTIEPITETLEETYKIESILRNLLGDYQYSEIEVKGNVELYEIILNKKNLFEVHARMQDFQGDFFVADLNHSLGMQIVCIQQNEKWRHNQQLMNATLLSMIQRNNKQDVDFVIVPFNGKIEKEIYLEQGILKLQHLNHLINRYADGSSTVPTTALLNAAAMLLKLKPNPLGKITILMHSYENAEMFSSYWKSSFLQYKEQYNLFITLMLCCDEPKVPATCWYADEIIYLGNKFQNIRLLH